MELTASDSPASGSEIPDFSAVHLARLIAGGELSPVEATEACLERVDRYNGVLNAVVTLNDRALDEARALEESARSGETPGPLHGLPVGIKDVTPVAGVRTTYGSPLYSDHVPSEDALVVRRLRDAGAVILGKTNTPEFAAGAHTFNDVFGPTRNPWDPTRSAGGSSGGSAAGLASGMFPLAEGTDLGGSLRVPASFCGVVGLRSSPGLVPTAPTDYLWDTLQVTGGMARTAEDLALMLDAIRGPSTRSPLLYGRREGLLERVREAQRGSAAELRLAYSPDIAGVGVDPRVERVCREAVGALADAGAQVEEIELDLSFGHAAFLALRGYWMVAHHRERLSRLDELGDNLAGNIRAGLGLTMRELADAEAARGRVWGVLEKLFETHAHLLTPCVAIPPFPVEQPYPETIAGKKMESYVDWFAPTFLLSLSGLPVASAPCGLDDSGLPVGLQIVGRPLGEAEVLGVAARLQAVRPIGGPDLTKLDAD